MDFEKELTIIDVETKINQQHKYLITARAKYDFPGSMDDKTGKVDDRLKGDKKIEQFTSFLTFNDKSLEELIGVKISKNPAPAAPFAFNKENAEVTEKLLYKSLGVKISPRWINIATPGNFTKLIQPNDLVLSRIEALQRIIFNYEYVHGQDMLTVTPHDKISDVYAEFITPQYYVDKGWMHHNRPHYSIIVKLSSVEFKALNAIPDPKIMQVSFKFKDELKEEKENLTTSTIKIPPNALPKKK